MSVTETDVLALADRFISAIGAGDLDTVRSIYAPDAVIWHNNDDQTQTVEENLRTLGWVTTHLKNLRYEDIRCQATTDGYVEQHVLRATAPNGTDLEIRACLVVDVVDGRITRLAEYLDSAAIAALFNR